MHARASVTLAQSLNDSKTIVEIYISIGCFALKDVTDIINDRCSLCCPVTVSVQVVRIQIFAMQLDASKIIISRGYFFGFPSHFHQVSSTFRYLLCWAQDSRWTWPHQRSSLQTVAVCRGEGIVALYWTDPWNMDILGSNHFLSWLFNNNTDKVKLWQ